MEKTPSALKYARLSEASREKHRERNRNNKNRKRTERLEQMMREVREFREDAYEMVEVDKLDSEASHILLKMLKKEIEGEVRRRITRGENPVFGVESAKIAGKIRQQRDRLEEKERQKIQEMEARLSPNK